jgi:hypothetical protein
MTDRPAAGFGSGAGRLSGAGRHCRRAAVWVGVEAVAAAPVDVVLGLAGRGCGGQVVHAGGLADGIEEPLVSRRVTRTAG